MMFCKLHLCFLLSNRNAPEMRHNTCKKQTVTTVQSYSCLLSLSASLFVFHQFPACLLVQVAGYLDLDGDVLVAVDVRIFHRYNSFSTQPDLAARLSPFFDFTTDIPV